MLPRGKGGADAGIARRFHFRKARPSQSAAMTALSPRGRTLLYRLFAASGLAAAAMFGTGHQAHSGYCDAMLELRPICENCAKPLPPASAEARICSYECTFCADCVDTVLHNVCPNCGGGFVPRPVRPQHNWRPNTSILGDPPTLTQKHKPVDQAGHDAFSAAIRLIDPAQR